MGRIITNLVRFTPVDGDFIYGRIKDNPGDNTGTPMNEDSFGDIFQFFARLMDQAGITPNGLPDCDYSGFQFFEAFKALAYDPGTRVSMDSGLLNGFSSGVDEPSYRKDCMGNVYLSGIIFAPSSQHIFFVLPVGFRPSRKVLTTIINDSNADVFRLQIDTNGTCNMFKLDGTDPVLSAKAFINCIFNVND